jgi:response regulator RpfG family c-di-GMP phosphodiesterase
MEKDRLLLSALRAVAAAVNRRDPYTSGHSERVAEYCDSVARSLKLSDDHRYFLSLSAWLHDLGILSTPRYILRKPSIDRDRARVRPVRTEVRDSFANAGNLRGSERDVICDSRN